MTEEPDTGPVGPEEESREGRRLPGPDDRLRLLRRLADWSYDGGVHGTCFECPFASPPLDQYGSVAEWRDISNDPTEAFFRCSLPGRDNEAVAWGEYAPCTEIEWFDGVVAATALPPSRDSTPDPLE